uniref:NADH-ubiquinone oxidoreductase chain 4L n=1 Tax=Lepidopsocidae sp. RS-2001 TaxID=159971 RepID=Q7YHL7_9NEOP|nr:NADH dehydrogenase subunit 4L [Lepidopsocidae sp. RS-2001]AAP44721.1 NADH dehydrogenase subunit 4L [Lepidopsocidae sp. RS-2001]
MMNFVFYFNSFCMLFIMLSYVLNRKYILMMLISLEFMSLILFLLIYFSLFNLNLEGYFLMIFLTFCVCEGVIGLSLLVGMIRSHGNDLIYSLSFLKC